MEELEGNENEVGTSGVHATNKEWMELEDSSVEVQADPDIPPSNLPFEVTFESKDFETLSDEDFDDEDLTAAGFTGGVKPNCVEAGIFIGKTFSTMEELDSALWEYEAVCGWRLTRLKKSPTVLRALCRGWDKHTRTGCGVELSARLIKRTGLITISKVYLKHTCSSSIHKFRNGSHRSKWIAQKLKKHVQMNPNVPMKELNENLRSFHDTSSVKWSLQRARAICREQITDGDKELFQKIPSYIKAILKVDPSAHACYQTGEDQRFVRMFIATSSSQTIFTHCRPLVGLDGTHTGGKFPSIILFATCFDGENHIVILAWAVVPVENTNHWTWFMENMRQSFAKMLEATTVFISDRDKGLAAAVADVFPNAQHAHCVQHLRANVKGNCDVHCSNVFKKLADAKTRAEFENILTTFQPKNDRQAKFVPYVRKLNEFAYARHAFPGRRWGHNTSNVVEIINSAVKPCRSKPALLLSDYLWVYCMEHHFNRSQHAKQLSEGEYALTEYANNLYNRLYSISRSIKESRSSETESLMHDADGTWAVRIQDRYCDCTDWREMEFPCAHAIKFLSEHGQDARQLVGEVWLVRNQVQTYKTPIPPLSIDRLEAATERCRLPLVTEKKKTKVQPKRAPSYGEQMARANDRLVKKQNQKCGRCKQPGHNQRSCVVLPPPCATAPTSGRRSTSRTGAEVVSIQSTSHETLVVGNDHSAMRSHTNEAFEFFHTRATTINFTEWIDSQPGPPQATQ